MGSSPTQGPILVPLNIRRRNITCNRKGAILLGIEAHMATPNNRTIVRILLPLGLRILGNRFKLLF